MNASLVSRLKVEAECKISGNGRHDGLGHNAKYVTYLLMNQQANEIIEFSVSQVTETSYSNGMEKPSFIKVLKEVKQKGILIKEIVTGRHSGVWKNMREEETGITHQFDVLPFAIVSWKKIDAVSKRKPCTVFGNGGNLFQTTSTQPVSFWKKRKGYYVKNGYLFYFTFKKT